MSQPRPKRDVGGKSEEVWADLKTWPEAQSLVPDLRERVARGELEYGDRLHSHNGRDALADAYEEALDCVMYLAQAHLERASRREAVDMLTMSLAFDLADALRAQVAR